MLQKLFKLKENKTDVKTELVAGLTTFMTMAYILAVNPGIFSVVGMDAGAVFTATALAAIIGTLCMAIFANYPFALAPGMGLNAYFAYTVVLSMGYSWQIALTAVFVEGIIFILLSLFNIREMIFNAIPAALKYAVSAGIGLFIAFIALQNANLVIGGATLVQLIDIDAMNAAAAGTAAEGLYAFSNVGMGALLCVIGVLLTGILVVKKVKGNVLLGILGTWILGIICELAGLYQPCPEVGMYSVIPSGIVSLPTGIGSIAGQCFQFDGISILNFITIVFAFLFVDLFDTIGTLIGVSAKANMLDKDGKLPRIKGALLADAVATTVGAALGTSTTTTYVESASGVSEGGRTGLTAVSTAVCFGLALFFWPVFSAIPAFATAPAMIIVGFFMIGSITKIDFSDPTQGIPAFVTVIAMPLFYSISEGISMGVIAYVVMNLVAGKEKAKKVGPLMYVLAVLFILKYIFL